MSHSTDYHDYVFKNGKLVGQFDQMYKKSGDIPWHQDETAYKIFSDIDLTILDQFNYESICDIGCGLGYFSNRLHKELNLSGKKGNPSVTGIDVSETAIKKAKKMFAGIRFTSCDLLEERPLCGEYFDLVVVKGVLWYVCHKLNHFLQNAIDMVGDGKFFYISQSFPDADKWVGQEVLDSPETLKSILLGYARPIHYCIEQHVESGEGGVVVHFLGVKRKNRDQN